VGQCYPDMVLMGARKYVQMDGDFITGKCQVNEVHSLFYRFLVYALLQYEINHHCGDLSHLCPYSIFLPVFFLECNTDKSV